MIYILRTARKGNLIKSRLKKTIYSYKCFKPLFETNWKTVRSCENLLATLLEYLKISKILIINLYFVFLAMISIWQKVIEKTHAQDCVAILAPKDQPFSFNSQQRSKIPGKEVVWKCCKKWASIFKVKPRVTPTPSELITANLIPWLFNVLTEKLRLFVEQMLHSIVNPVPRETLADRSQGPEIPWDRECGTHFLGRYPKVRTSRPDHVRSSHFDCSKKLFLRVFAEKPSPSSILFQDLTNVAG